MAKIETWNDAGGAETIRDEHGGLWRVAIEGADGTLAVEEIEEYGGGPAIPQTSEATAIRAGIFSWGEDAEGEIYPVNDGETYGVNCTEEFVACGGEWIENDE